MLRRTPSQTSAYIQRKTENREPNEKTTYRAQSIPNLRDTTSQRGIKH